MTDSRNNDPMQDEQTDDNGFRVASAAGSMLRRMRDQETDENEQFDPSGRFTPDVPISADELKLMRELQERGTTATPQITERKALGQAEVPPDRPDKETTGSMSLFPDLPPELRPQRPDGTGALTLRDIEEMERLGTTPLLTKIASKQAKVAIEHLQEGMAKVAQEFSDGQINHGQFQAVYTRYAEQRAMIERMRSTDPKSTAWKDSLPARGQTAYLRRQFAAHVMGCLIVDNMQASTIRKFGEFDLEGELLTPILTSLQNAPLSSMGLPERSTQIEGRRWLSVAPGQYATTIVVFSMEPSAAQRTMVADLHRDFERANHRVLRLGQVTANRLVYPQRMLFDSE